MKSSPRVKLILKQCHLSFFVVTNEMKEGTFCGGETDGIGCRTRVRIISVWGIVESDPVRLCLTRVRPRWHMAILKNRGTMKWLLRKSLDQGIYRILSALQIWFFTIRTHPWFQGASNETTFSISEYSALYVSLLIIFILEEHAVTYRNGAAFLILPAEEEYVVIEFLDVDA